VLTAASRFDGHDVSINIFRRLLQEKGAEVIHLGHNRSVQEVVQSAIEEDVDAVLVSSYQGGHNEYFRYLVDLLKEKGADDILIFGGGGGVILPSEINALEEYGVERLYHAEDGRELGVHGIADDIISRIHRKRSNYNPVEKIKNEIKKLTPQNKFLLGKILSAYESFKHISEFNELDNKVSALPDHASIVLGITGTGGSGKSSLTDELVLRFLKTSPDITIGIIAVDPSKSTGKGALLGDRIRMNTIYNERVYFRSFATRESGSELSTSAVDAVHVLKKAGFDLIIVETSGIGQGDNKITSVADYSMYVMTQEFGAPTQLDKINMLDLADFIVVNKSDHVGAEDALREVILKYIRTKNIKVNLSSRQSLFDLDIPVYSTNASEFNNDGCNKLFKDLVEKFQERKPAYTIDQGIFDILPTAAHKDFSRLHYKNTNYLAEIADTIRNYHKKTKREVELAKKCYSLKNTIQILKEQSGTASSTLEELQKLFDHYYHQLQPESREFLEKWPEIKARYQQPTMTYNVRGKEIKVQTYHESICGTHIPKVALPKYDSWGELLEFYYKENLPGYFPYTAGVYPFKRTTEDPRRQFAGEGTPERTNKRFHYLCRNDKAKRLSVAFDGVTLYGEDPSYEPDIYGKVGESGVSICNLEDMMKLFDGFDLADPLTSVSMTINGPAPIMLALYFMTAVKQQEQKVGRKLDDSEKIALFQKLRGTVQADILKEDQAQNTCIFSIDFSLRMIGDIQQYFVKHKIRNYYSLSISGYHIAEAGANPITQLAFTLANGFHYVEFFKSLGMDVNDFAPNLSFFFSNGMDPEYSVIGRVARRIWAIAMKEKYGANERSQKLKYHIQTSGRSLHAQEIDFNDIRTTLQALMAYYDNCNSLHTNAYDEAVTTPTEESVRRAVAIQLILNKEFGLAKNENPNQGSFIIEELTDLVEEAVLQEFYRISYRGGVLGAMEKQYQRSRIQEESLYYEELKEKGEYPIVGVNTFVDERNIAKAYDEMEITRATTEEKEYQIRHVKEFQQKHGDKKREKAFRDLKEKILRGENIFEALLEAVNYLSLGDITHLLYEIGGKYRRNI
jgi:methylmalonyl-CoA mutase